jgi:predicted amidohydrolase
MWVCLLVRLADRCFALHDVTPHPKGEVLVEASGADQGQQVLVVELDLTKVDEFRQNVSWYIFWTDPLCLRRWRANGCFTPVCFAGDEG